jgi:hypothetical protein
MVNPGYTRRQEFACTLEELEQYAAAILYKNEVLYVKQADGSYDILIGDGVTPVGELRYVIRFSDIQNFRAAAESAASLATAAALEAQRKVDELNGLDFSLSVVDGLINIEFEEEL